MFDDGCSKSSTFTYQFLENGGFTSESYESINGHIEVSMKFFKMRHFMNFFLEKIHYQKTVFENLGAVSFMLNYCLIMPILEM